MALAPGTRLGPYEIAAFLGAGGMGEVYRAVDVRLGRAVAVKVLTPRSTDAGPLRARFEREARSIAALSHPHICTLHDVGREDDTDFLVMEYLEGQTLSARLAGRTSTGDRQSEPLPLDETIRLATQLADALTAAHRAGIVHRDLKPGNLMLTAHGLIVLDFGLAKLTPAPSQDPHMLSTTDTAPLTMAGALVGTVPYMAPEQLEGREADKRSDIFSFGAIVYEMLTGRRAFSGDSQASLIAAIIAREPTPPSVIEPRTPPGLDRLVRKCLAKDPDARWQSASDIADELRWIAAGSASTEASASTAPAPRVRRPSWTLIAVATAAAVLAAVAGIKFLGRSAATPPPSESRHRQITFSGDVVMAAMAPDGSMIAYATGNADSGMRVLVRDLAAGQAVEIFQRRVVTDLAWMPDGSRVVVAAYDDGGRGVWTVPRLGGQAQPVRSTPDYAAYVTVAPDSSAFAVTNMDQHGFQVITTDGQRRDPVVLEGFQWLNALDWSRRDRVVLLTTDSDGASVLWTVSPAGENLRRVHASEDPLQGLCSSPDGDAIYTLRNRNEAAELVRFDVASGREEAGEIVMGPLSVVFSATSRLDCSISRDGTRLLYPRGAAYANLWKLEIGKSESPVQLTRGTSLLAYPSVSADGQWIAALAGTEADPQIVRVPATGEGEPVRIRAGGPPRLSPDGKKLAFVSIQEKSQVVMVSDADGQGATAVTGTAPANPFVHWLPDGRLAWSTPDARDFRIRYPGEPVQKEEGLQIAKPVGWMLDLRFSPTGGRVAITWNRDEHVGLWVMLLPERTARELARDLWPIGWSSDEQWIYAHNERRAVVRVSTTDGRTENVILFPTGNLEPGCDMTADRKALICAVQEQHSDAWVAEHFDQRRRPAR